MSEELGPLTYGHKSEEVFLGRDINRDRNYSDAIAYAIDKEASQYMETSYKKAEKILEEHMDLLHQVAVKLMEQETIAAKEFEAIMQGQSGEAELTAVENDQAEGKSETKA
jgi:cell division protease FtsH